MQLLVAKLEIGIAAELNAADREHSRRRTVGQGHVLAGAGRAHLLIAECQGFGLSFITPDPLNRFRSAGPLPHHRSIAVDGQCSRAASGGTWIKRNLDRARGQESPVRCSCWR